MNSIIEKQILEWKEELTKQIQRRDQAQKVLEETSKTILMIEGGIQAKEVLLKKIELEDQQISKEEQVQVSKQKPSK
tara:strand:- start:538 stop:768 length:231 start_codon:yes stop_codon:yes gene_type:complete